MIFIIGAIVISQFFAAGGVSASGLGSLVFQNVICHAQHLAKKDYMITTYATF